MKKFKLFTQTLLFSFLTTACFAQIKSINYDLEYNPSTSLYDVYLIVDEGNAKKKFDRLQFSTQVSLVAKAGTTVSVEKTYMPLIDNANYDSAKPANWEVEAYLDAPEVSPEKAYVSVIPTGIHAYFYNDVNEGDRVKLFSVSVSPMLNCGEDLRLFANDSDPSSLEKGMKGADFKNVLYVGGLAQSYAKNEEFEHIDYLKVNEVTLDKSGNLIADVSNKLSTDVKYEWYGPNGMISTSKYAPSLTEDQFLSGDYKLVVSNDIGCKDEYVISTRSEEEDLRIAAASLYPNPAKDIVTIDFENVDTDVTLNVYDLSGRQVMTPINYSKEDVLNGTVQFTVKELAGGFYNVKLNHNGKLLSSKKLLVVK